MKMYFVVDDRLSTRGAIFNEKSFESLEQAEKEANKQLSYMTDREKKECDGFYIELCEVDEDGLPEDGALTEIVKTYI